MPPSADELRELQQRAVQSVESTSPVAVKSFSAEQAGLSKRDYVPLAIAIFVDICLLLVSMGRPMNRLQGLVPKMVAAERGPVYQILSRFTDIHSDAEMRQKFEIFRHVVFDYGGDYYVAVPLDAPWNRNPREQQELLAEAHLLSNLFSSFEKEKIFKRVYSPFLKTSSIQKKLGRQGSKFAHCKAFRVYRFADGAWSEIILGAVMGAAKRVEAEKRKRRERGGNDPAFPELPGGNLSGFRDAARHMRPPAPATSQWAPAAGHAVPSAEGWETRPMAAGHRRSAFAVHPQQPAQQPAPRPPIAAARPAPGQAPVAPPANDTTAAFGPYARFAPPDHGLPAEPQREPSVAQWSSEIARREADVTVRPVETAPLPENVVAMPVRMPPQAAVHDSRGTGVDVELTRETIRYTLPTQSPDGATITVPTSPAVLPATLAKLAAASRVIEQQPAPAAIEQAVEGRQPTAAGQTDRGDATWMATRLVTHEPAE